MQLDQVDRSLIATTNSGRRPAANEMPAKITLPDARMVTALIENHHRVGGELQRELVGLHSARRGAYRAIYEIDDDLHVVIVLRVDHRSRAYRTR